MANIKNWRNRQPGYENAVEAFNPGSGNMSVPLPYSAGDAAPASTGSKKLLQDYMKKKQSREDDRYGPGVGEQNLQDSPEMQIRRFNAPDKYNYSTSNVNDFSKLSRDNSAAEASMRLNAEQQAARSKFASSNGTNSDLPASKGESGNQTGLGVAGMGIQAAQNMAPAAGLGFNTAMSAAGGGVAGASLASEAGGLTGPEGAVIGAGIMAGTSLIGGLAQQRMANRQKANDARANAFNKEADIYAQNSSTQQSAIANIMAAIRSSFLG